MVSEELLLVLTNWNFNQHCRVSGSMDVLLLAQLWDGFRFIFKIWMAIFDLIEYFLCKLNPILAAYWSFCLNFSSRVSRTMHISSSLWWISIWSVMIFLARSVIQKFWKHKVRFAVWNPSLNSFLDDLFLQIPSLMNRKRTNGPVVRPYRLLWSIAIGLDWSLVEWIRSWNISILKDIKEIIFEIGEKYFF